MLGLHWTKHFFVCPNAFEFASRVSHSVSLTTCCAKTQNPKQVSLNPKGTTTPNRFSSKPFARHTNNEPTKVVRSLSVFKYATLAVLTLLSALVTHLSQAIQSKASRMQEAFKLRKLYSQTNSWWVKPSFQPSIPNIHSHLTNQLESGAMRCSPLRSSLSPQAERLTETLFSSLRGAMHHKMLPNCGRMHKSSNHATKVHLTGKHGTSGAYSIPKQPSKAPKL